MGWFYFNEEYFKYTNKGRENRHTPELLKACRLLREYAQYVEQVRIFARKLPFPEAVKKAVDYCIMEGILADFLTKNRAEAIEMSIFEFDEEKYIKAEREKS